MKDLGLLSDKYTVLVTGTVQEEDCDGLCWQYIINEDKVRPEFVVSTEPQTAVSTAAREDVWRSVWTSKAFPATVPLRSAATTRSIKMADILQDVRALNENDAADDKEVKGLVKMLDENTTRNGKKPTS